MSAFEDMFKPYSPETHGDLEEYLLKHDGSNASSNFFGPEYFFIIKERGYMLPNCTRIRVNMSPIPDIGYFVNSDYKLESHGEGHSNMSLMGAKKGVYNPRKVLKGKSWSIAGLNVPEPMI